MVLLYLFGHLTVQHQVLKFVLRREKKVKKITLKKNELPVPVSIHWHGYPVPNNMDGIPGVTQDAVMPGKKALRMNLLLIHREHTGTILIRTL
ncbi:hypothetical protein GCM10020331_055010 [Ectobacillus funiculus]